MFMQSLEKMHLRMPCIIIHPPWIIIVFHTDLRYVRYGLRYISFTTIVQYLVESPLTVTTTATLLGYASISFAHFVRFFLAKIAQALSDWMDMKSNFHFLPQVHNQIEVWVLNGPFLLIQAFGFEPFQCNFGGSLGLKINNNKIKTLKKFLAE